MTMIIRKAVLVPIRFGYMPSSFSYAGLRGSTSHQRDVEFIQNKIPKRMSAVGLFVKDHFASVKQSKAAGTRSSEIMRICFQDFKALPPEKLQKYKATADKSLEAYRKAKKLLTDKEREILRIDRKAGIQTTKRLKAARSLNKLKKDYGYPEVKGSTALALLRADKRSELKGLKAVSESGRKLGEIWGKLPEVEKKKYLEKAAAAVAAQKSAVKKWEEDMKKKGNDAILEHIRVLKHTHLIASRSVKKLSQGFDDVKPKKLKKKTKKRVGLKTKSRSKSRRVGAKRKPGLKTKSTKKAVTAKKNVAASEKKSNVRKTSEKKPKSISGKKKSGKKDSKTDSD